MKTPTPPLLPPTQTPKPPSSSSSNRTKPKESSNSKRSEISSTESKILKSSASNLPESSSEKENLQKIVAKSLTSEFEAVSEEISLISALDQEPEVSLISLESESIVSSEMDDTVVDLMKESVIEFKKLVGAFDSLVRDLGREGRRAGGCRQNSDEILWSKLMVGVMVFLIVVVLVLNVLLVASDEVTFSGGLYPT